MKVQFDSQIFVSQRFGGISRYFASLAREMYSIPGIEPRIEAPLYISEYLQRLPPGLIHGRVAPIQRAPISLSYAANVALSWLATKHFRPDVLHQTYYYPFGVKTSSASIVTTVHDLIHEKYPEGLAASSAFSRWKEKNVRRADWIICVSESTRRDVLEAYGLDEARVSVVHHGCDPLVAPADRAGRRASEKPYILFVGVRVGYKNFAGLLDAYASSKLLRESFDLLCFGGGRFTEDENAMIKRAGVTAMVRHVSGSDELLAEAYVGAQLLAYPSKYEGFGFPLLEAMSLGCPIACGDTSSLPEVAGAAAEYFDPNQPQSIRVTLESLVLSRQRLQELRIAGFARVSQFSWRRCAEQTLAVYNRLL